MELKIDIPEYDKTGGSNSNGLMALQLSPLMIMV